MKVTRISAIWCTSCIVTYNDFMKIKEDYPNFTYQELDYDTDNIEKYNVKDIIPVIIIEKDDREILRIVGEKKYKDIKKLIEEVI